MAFRGHVVIFKPSTDGSSSSAALAPGEGLHLFNVPNHIILSHRLTKNKYLDQCLGATDSAVLAVCMFVFE